jgi:phage terminase large subunit GpA-like protein
MNCAIQSIDRLTADALAVLRPPPDLTVSQWADEFRRLSAEASAEPGRWSTERAPYQRGILDALNHPDVETVVVMSSAQIGKTELILNVIGYYVDQDPSPILLLQPTLDMAESFSKDRLAPMVRDTPALCGKIADPRARDSGNTLLHKKFPGGHITMAGANSPASLASRPIRVVLCDEVDRYPVSAAAEGDPVALARKRTSNFHNRRVVLVSTPTIKGFSRIESAYEQSDRRRYWVPCPHCGEHQVLRWAAVTWPDGQPGEAAINCQHCGAIWTEAQRRAALRLGEWRAEGDFDGVAGFWLSELYSPWSSPARMAKALIEARAGGTEQVKTWVNTSLGESWEEEGDTIEPHALRALCAEMGEDIPDDVCLLTVGADVQQDRLEVELVGWGTGERSWSVDYAILPGSPADEDVWHQLDALISARYPREDGAMLSVSTVCIDSGYLPKRVYEFCKRQGMHVLPVVGRAGMNRPVVESGRARLRRLRKRASQGVKPEIIGVDEAKAIIYRRLRAKRTDPGGCTFPADRDDEYFDQLTAEKLVRRYSKGRPVIEWVKTRPRNEALDCRVYAYAALLLSGVDLEREAERRASGNASRAPSRPKLPTRIRL